ncbi:MAG: CocE/NonD family hydrolase [Myxococcota bacterium]
MSRVREVDDAHSVRCPEIPLLADPDSSSMFVSRIIRLGRPALVALCIWAGTAPALAFQGPFPSNVTVAPGVALDVDVRWPDSGAPPASGWPVLFLAHPAGGTKNTFAGLAGTFADDGYVTLTYTNRVGATGLPPEVFAADLAELKAWILDDFGAAAGVPDPLDPDAFGMFGQSLGGYATWSAVLLTDLFAVAVPFNWSFHTFVDHVENNGSLERTTGRSLADLVGGVYPAAAVDAALEGTFGPALANFPNVTIPVHNQIAMLDGRASGSQALSDHLALSAAADRMLYLGTGGHGTPNDDADFRSDLRARFFDRYLKGEANGIDTEDAIRVALLGTNEPLSFASWPPAGQTAVDLYLGPGGSLMPTVPSIGEAFDAFENDPGGLSWGAVAPGFPLATLRSQIVRDVIRYDTPPLASEVLLVGEPAVELFVEGTGSAYQVNVHLFDVAPDGAPTMLAFATATTSVSPSTLALDLTATGRRVPAGHRLRLEITNRDDQDVDPTNAFDPESDTLRYIPFFEFSANRVYRDVVRPSSLTLPVIGASALPFSPAVPSASLATRVLLGIALVVLGVRRFRPA